MGAKIFLAALKGYEKEGVKPKRLLESFFYLRGNSDRYMEFVKKEIKLENFLLDSGAFTFMNLKKQKTILINMLRVMLILSKSGISNIFLNWMLTTFWDTKK